VPLIGGHGEMLADRATVEQPAAAAGRAPTWSIAEIWDFTAPVPRDRSRATVSGPV
jgi:hypothetical protein